MIRVSNGHAVAGGCIIAAAADLRLMSGGSIGLTELLVGVPFPTVALEIARYAFGAHAGPLALTGEMNRRLQDQTRRRIIDRRDADDRVVADVWTSDTARADIAAFLDRLAAR